MRTDAPASRPRLLVLALSVVLMIGVLSLAWEFWLEDPAKEWLDFGRPETTAERWQYVLTSLVFAGLAFIGPAWMSARHARVRAAAEEARRRTERRYERLFDNLSDATTVWSVDADGRVGCCIEANRAAVTMLGFSREELRGMSPADITSADGQPGLADGMRLLQDTGHATFETVHRTEDGRTIPVQVSSHLFEQEDGRVLLSLARDVTARKQSEREREQLIAELRDALSKIKVLSGLLPICANCKAIRDDQGRYHRVEAYLASRSDVSFTHGICPDCMRQLYPDLSK